MAKLIGVDLGGTNLRAALVDPETGAVSGRRSVPTEAHEGHEAVIERMGDLVAAVLAEAGQGVAVRAIGIGAPGTVDMARGVVRFLPNLPGQWRDVPLGARISARTGLPVQVLNDVRAITYGEWAFGAGRGVDNVVCYAIGTGIGGGLIIGGELHLGIDGTAGELGHTVVEPDGPPCSCGGRGCLELYTSGPAIEALAAKAVIHGHTTRIDRLVGHDLNKITVEVVAQAAAGGDAVAGEIFERVGRYLGIAIGNALGTVSPERVILAGGVAQVGERLFDPIRRTLRERVHLVPVEKVEILPAALGGNAGLVGSALWAGKHG